KLINGKYETEASGNINKTTVRQYAECGVDFVSVGSLTHQIHSLDLSLKAIV
ncbi:MAG: nicotinate-nucleotide diphosphorylase (carboxylating), partial [Bacteroidota bacterium]|nr:nicotinate-nucleotide diphosphorylase (carboxylating) [Bacteroidota bacterium]